MFTFLKSQTASLVASAIDIAITLACVELIGVWYGLASVLGNVSGALINFIIGRQWVFSATHASAGKQAWKYGVVWLGYVALNFLLLIIMTDYAGVNYGVSKVVVAVFLSVSYNYVLQKKFVFK